MNTTEKVAESNRIEGIHRSPTNAEIAEHERFVALDEVTVADLQRFVHIYQPNARLREMPGEDVRVGNHYPPPGGPRVREALEAFLVRLHDGILTPFELHAQYEMLHPFTDGNGRSGRAIWYWLMLGHSLGDLGFLHAWYYQSLRHLQDRRK